MAKKILVIFALVSVISCKKDKSNPSPTDVRAKFIGKYQCSFKLNCYGSCGTCSIEKDSIVIVKFGATPNSLLVLGRDVTLDADGNFSAYHYSLMLANDSLQSNFMNGGLACGQFENFIGFKISQDTL